METEHSGRPPSLPSAHQVSIPQKIAYGAGGLTDFLYINFVNAMAVPIFAIALKMDPFLVAIAMAIPKVVGAIMDPLIGTWSDNLRSRWGRRRPFILVGGIAGVLLLPFIWMPPVESQTGMFIWLAGLLMVFAIAYSTFAVPYGALGYQLTTNYDERTSVLAWRGYIQVIGVFGAAWFYWFCRLDIFGNEVHGVRWLSLIVGLVMLIGVISTVLGPRERIHAVEKQPSIALWPALKMTFGNKPFLLLQGAILIIALGTGCEGLIGSYVHIYFTCQGDKDFASLISGMGGTATVIPSLLAPLIGLFLASLTGKRTTALVAIGICLFAVLILPFTLVPETPYLIIVTWVISAFGMPAASLMFGSMTADITDEDELETGYRREGMYVAVGGFLGKIINIVTLLLGGWLPHLAGYVDTSVPPNQTELGIMRWMLIGIQIAALAAAFSIIWFFPLTRARSEEIRRLLDERGRAKTPDPA
jgi:glycoside/pentoside/hexuronide:cation symporter, GPH family